MHVEDHPLDYADFEGVIPKGEYGGGTVMLWDRGSWYPLEAGAADPQRAYEEGRLKFRLEGEKLHGAWMLVRMKPRPGEEGVDNWLLFKERDAEARSGEAADVGRLLTDSVKSGRSLDEIAAHGVRGPGSPAGAASGWTSRPSGAPAGGRCRSALRPSSRRSQSGRRAVRAGCRRSSSTATG